MGLSDRTTIRTDDKREPDKGKSHPPGLLKFYPLGSPPAMQYFALSTTEVTIGRGTNCTICLDDHEASRLHLRIDCKKRYWQITDCESTNGVYLNGRKVSVQPLVGGEVIRVGTTFFRFFMNGLFGEDRKYPLSRGPMVTGPCFETMRALLDRAAGSALSVLITGETGTGKELVAAHLHEAGPRRGNPFIPVNCSAIPHNIFEAELFGHVKGAFTGATESRPGLIRQASGGTLFLDEIAEIPLESQAKMLRVLQDRSVRSLGASGATTVDIRVVSATNRDLEQLVGDGRFRADLYARISDLTVQLPPLRRRVEDIPALVEHFLVKHGSGQRFSLTAQAVEHLCTQRFSYNIRELESAVRRAMLLAEGTGGSLEPEHFAEKVLRPSSAPAPKDLEAKVATPNDELRKLRFSPDAEAHPQAQRLVEALRHHSGDVNKAAADLEISRSQLYRRAQKFGVDVSRFRR